MATTRDVIRGWLEQAKKGEATHVIIVCDTYDWEDYPVLVTREQDVHEVEEYFRKQDMQQVMEVYSLSMDIDKQLNEHRAFNY